MLLSQGIPSLGFRWWKGQNHACWTAIDEYKFFPSFNIKIWGFN